MRIAIPLTAVVVSALALAGCHSRRSSYAPGPAPASPPTAAAISNTICPVMGRPVDPSIPTSVYRGRVIGFCCRACKPMFDANPEAYAGNIR